MPTRFNGSAPLTATNSPSSCSLRVLRSRPTASGSAYCSPENPPTNRPPRISPRASRSEEHTSELQSQSNLVCRLLLEKKKKTQLDSNHIHPTEIGRLPRQRPPERPQPSDT